METMLAISDPGSLQIGPVAVGQDPADQLSGYQNLETHRHIRMVDVLGPAGD